jgi:hypothetical protein
MEGFEGSDELYDEDENDDPLADLMEECGLGADGQCSMAGSEHCDFVCPMRDSEEFCGSAAWKKKHGIK